MTAPEFSRLVRTRPAVPERLSIEANDAERAALAERFSVAELHSLRAELRFDPDGEAIDARGTLTADLTQLCAVSDEHFAVRIEEPLSLRFGNRITELFRSVEPELNCFVCVSQCVRLRLAMRHATR